METSSPSDLSSSNKLEETISQWYFDYSVYKCTQLFLSDSRSKAWEQLKVALKHYGMLDKTDNFLFI